MQDIVGTSSANVIGEAHQFIELILCEVLSRDVSSHSTFGDPDAVLQTSY
jgi:hypothetical protein